MPTRLPNNWRYRYSHLWWLRISWSRYRTVSAWTCLRPWRSGGGSWHPGGGGACVCPAWWANPPHHTRRRARILAWCCPSTRPHAWSDTSPADTPSRSWLSSQPSQSYCLDFIIIITSPTLPHFRAWMFFAVPPFFPFFCLSLPPPCVVPLHLPAICFNSSPTSSISNRRLQASAPSFCLFYLLFPAILWFL